MTKTVTKKKILHYQENFSTHFVYKLGKHKSDPPNGTLSCYLITAGIILISV
jgi:hypothetical protein